MSKEKVICFGEVLWDALPDGIYLGGAPLNVALNLTKLGVNTRIVSAVGSDTLGSLAIKSITKRGLDTEYIQVNDKPTGLTEVVIDAEGVPSYSILQDVAWDYISITDEMKKVVEESDYLILGTLIFRGISENTIRELLRNYEGKCVVDVNFRESFYSKELLDEVLEFANIVKFSEDEFLEVLSWKNKSKNIEEGLGWLSSEFDIEYVFLTMGERGAYLYQNGELIKKERYPVKVKDTIGAGDAFLAASIYKIIQAENSYNTLCFANALGAYVASSDGATPNLDMSEIETLMKHNV